MNTTESTQQPGQGTIGRKLAVNSVVAMLTQTIHLVSRIAITPFVLSYIPLDQYGLWTICFVILSYAGLSAFGVNNAYVKFVAEHRARGDVDAINELMSTGLACMSALCAAIFAALYLCLPLVLGQFSVDPASQGLASTLILGTAVAFLTDIGLGAFRGLVEGLQEIALASWVSLATVVVEVGLIFGLLPLGFGVKGMLYAYVFKTFLLVFCMACISFAKLPGLRLRPAYVRKRALSALFVFGGKIQIVGMLGLFIETFDKIVTTSLLGLEATGLLEIGRKFPNTARGFSGAAFAPFMPAASYLGGWWDGGQFPTPWQKGRKYLRLILLSLCLGLTFLLPVLSLGPISGVRLVPDVTLGSAGLTLGAVLAFLLLTGWLREYANRDEYFVGEGVRDIFLRGTRHIVLINSTVYFFLMASGDRLIFAWVGPGYEQAIPVLAVVALSNMIHQSTGPGTFILRGVNRAGREFEYMLVQCILIIVWIPALTHRYGLIGAACGFSLATSIGSLYFFARTFKALRVPWTEAAQTVGAPCLAPAAGAALAFLGFKALPDPTRWIAVLHIAVFGMLYLAFTGWLLKRWFLTAAERETVRQHVLPLCAKLNPFSRRRHG